jgi:hypothetical protein
MEGSAESGEAVMKISKRNLLFMAVVIIAGFAVAQILTPSTPAPSQLFPQGALVYWETSNLKDFLGWWKNSDIKKDWEKSTNYRVFENSRLYLRLKERISDFEKDKYQFSLENLIKLAGKRSAVAIYDIGELKILAVTETSQADAALNELWISRNKFTEKKFNNQVYYAEPQEGKLVFAYAKPFFVVSTESGLLEQFLTNVTAADQQLTLGQSEKFKACYPQNGTPSLFSIFIDQESLNQNRYFKKYWIHQNVKDLTVIRSGWIDFVAEPSGLSEQRHFALSNSHADSNTASTQDLSKLFKQLNADFLSIEPNPDPEQSAEAILKLLNQFPDRQKQTSYPPAYAGSFERALEAEAKSPYLVRIDDPIKQPSGLKILENDQPAKLASLLSALKPTVRIRLTTPIWDNDGLFMRFQDTQIVSLQNYDALKQEELLNQLQEYSVLLSSAGNNGASWINNNGSYELHSLIPIYVRFRKPWIVISNSQSELNSASAVLPSPALSVTTSFVAINWEKSRWKYSRLMRRLDYGMYKGDVPFFFSENLDSLFQALYSIKESTIETDGTTETVHYEIR